MLILSALVTIKLHHYGNNHEILFQSCSIYIFCFFFFLLLRAVSNKMLFSNLFINQPIPLFSLLLLLRTDSESSVVNVLFRLFGINGLIIYGLRYNLYQDGQCTGTMHSLFKCPPVCSSDSNFSLSLFICAHFVPRESHMFCIINILNVYFLNRMYN